MRILIPTWSAHGHLLPLLCLALSLQECAIGRHRWAEWLGQPFVLGDEVAARADAVTDHLVAEGYLIDDGGLISIGPEGEAAFGYQHFLELLSVFTSPPMLSVRHGRLEVGVVPDETLMIGPSGQGAGGPAVLLLGGRSWAVGHIDWTRRVVDVEPVEPPGIARWQGSGQPLSSTVGSTVRAVLVRVDPTGVTGGRSRPEVRPVRARSA